VDARPDARRRQGRPRIELESYSFVLLVRPDDAPAISDEEAEALQAQHLGHLAAMAEAGHLLLAGPFGDRPDESLRGLCVYRTDLETTRALAAQDPAVQAGRLRPVVMTWYTQKGSVTFNRV
jgi:uncharacterized protein YciI